VGGGLAHSAPRGHGGAAQAGAVPQRTKIALVATAHDLVRVMWAMLRRGTVWQKKLVPDA
jgi:hypothetical protein